MKQYTVIFILTTPSLLKKNTLIQIGHIYFTIIALTYLLTHFDIISQAGAIPPSQANYTTNRHRTKH